MEFPTTEGLVFYGIHLALLIPFTIFVVLYQRAKRRLINHLLETNPRLWAELGRPQMLVTSTRDDDTLAYRDAADDMAIGPARQRRFLRFLFWDQKRIGEANADAMLKRVRYRVRVCVLLASSLLVWTLFCVLHTVSM